MHKCIFNTAYTYTHFVIKSKIYNKKKCAVQTVSVFFIIIHLERILSLFIKNFVSGVILFFVVCPNSILKGNALESKFKIS